MKRIYILCDYKGFFESKQKTKIYRGGMNLKRIESIFQKSGIQVVIGGFQKKYLEKIKEGETVLYTSSEDNNVCYKSYIEDIIYHLEQKKIRVIPSYQCLKAHNNKVAMELLRQRINNPKISSIRSKTYGTIEELTDDMDSFVFPVVIKTFSGAMSKGVAKADNKAQLISIAKKFMRSRDIKHDTKELLRKVKYRNYYVRESFYRNKILVQNLIQKLNNDWKVLIYGNKAFVLYRGTRDNDFRASGSGKFAFRKDLPKGMLDFAFEIKEYFDVSHISLDIGFDGEVFHLIEFQFLYFGTTTLEKSKFHFEKIDNHWEIIEGKAELEEIYANAILNYLK